MSIERFFVRPVTIHYPNLVEDTYGNAVPDYDDPIDVEVKGWLHRLSESEEDSATRNADVTNWVLRLPLGTALASKDRVTIDGETFEVDGPPNRAWTPGGEHHVRAPLKRIDG